MRYEEEPSPPPRGFLDHQLDLARERVEEEIAAMDFVWGAWRELFEREPGPPGFEVMTAKPASARKEEVTP